MRMLKRKAVFSIMFTMCALLMGCSKKVDTVDIAALSNTLLENVVFEDELNVTDDTMIKKLYNIDDYEKAQVYISSGATSEEIAVFEFSSQKTAEEGFKKAQDRIASQKADFESYIPKEVKKLNDAVVKQFGQYVVVCVSNGDEAEKIITQQLR